MTLSTRQEIEGRVAAFAAAQTPPLAVAYENVPFTRPINVPFLECYLVSAGTITASLDATRNRERGTIAVNVWVPAGQGVGKADAIAAQIVKLFPVLPKTGNVSIEDPVNTGRFTLTTDGWGCVPCTCPYRVESTA